MRYADLPYALKLRYIPIFSGWTKKYFCDEGYVKEKSFFNYTIRTCKFGGNWDDEDTLNCLKRCPPLGKYTHIMM